MPRTLDSTLRFSGVSDVVAYTGTAGQSIAVPVNIHDIRVVCSSNAWIAIGTDPTATAADNSLYMPAGVVEYFHVSPGQKVSAVQDSAGGNLVVGFMTR